MSGEPMSVAIDRARAADLPLVAELARAAGHPDPVLPGLLADPDREILVARSAGPAAVLLDYHPSVWRLTVLAPVTPPVVLDWLIDQAAQAAVHLVTELHPADRAHPSDTPYRLAGFTDAPCSCRPEAGPVAAGTVLGHLAPRPGQPARAPRLSGPDLSLGPACIPWPVQLATGTARDAARPVAG